MTQRNRQLTSYELALVKWVEACQTDVPVIVEDSDGPRPRGEYLTIKVVSFVDSGTARRRVADEAFGTGCRGEVIQSYVGTVNVQAYGKTARERLDILGMSPSIQPIREIINALGLSIQGAADTLDLSAIEGTRTVPRFSADFVFGWALAVDFASDFIETLSLQEI